MAQASDVQAPETGKHHKMAQHMPAHARAKKAAGHKVQQHCLPICSEDYIDISRFDVNFPGAMEMVTQPLYHIQSYPAAGSTSLSFFQTPAGASSTTLEDTNMQLAGQLAAPQSFLITGISINWYPGQTAAAPVQLGAAAITGSLNDQAAVFRRGLVQLTVGNKNYGQWAALDMLPPRSHLNAAVATSDATTAAAALNLRMEVPYIDGAPFKINPYRLMASQNFKVTVDFPGGAVALPSGDALARIGVILWGTLFRPVQ